MVVFFILFIFLWLDFSVWVYFVSFELDIDRVGWSRRERGFVSRFGLEVGNDLDG